MGQELLLGKVACEQKLATLGKPDKWEFDVAGG